MTQKINIKDNSTSRPKASSNKTFKANRSSGKMVGNEVKKGKVPPISTSNKKK